MPHVPETSSHIELDAASLAMRLDGIDLRIVRRAPQWEPQRKKSASRGKAFSARHDQSYLLVPPDDNDTQHGCEWRDFANPLKCQLAIVEAKLEMVMRAFAKRSEKMGKMPKMARPPRTPSEVADSRLQQALLRADKVVTEEKVEPVPEALKKYPVCDGTRLPKRRKG